MLRELDVDMSLLLRTEYWDDLAARGAFKEFQITIHGLDLSEWDSAGYWDYAYAPFSFFDGAHVVSSQVGRVFDLRNLA